MLQGEPWKVCGLPGVAMLPRAAVNHGWNDTKLAIADSQHDFAGVATVKDRNAREHRACRGCARASQADVRRVWLLVRRLLRRHADAHLRRPRDEGHPHLVRRHVVQRHLRHGGARNQAGLRSGGCGYLGWVTPALQIKS